MTDTNPRDLIKRLADSLHEAAGEVEGWGNYASSYFQEKHDLRGNVARIYAEAAEARAYLAQSEPTLTVQDCNNMHKHKFNFLDEDRPGEITLDGCFTREDLIEIANNSALNSSPSPPSCVAKTNPSVRNPNA
jgi:hypothetical protein